MDVTSSGLPLVVPVPLAPTFGAMFLGTIVGFTLYGSTVHQTYRYLRLYWTDVPGLKLTVLILFAADTFHSIICLHLCYFYFVQHYADPQALEVGLWSLRLSIPASELVVILSQGFFARRVYLLGSWYSVFAALAGFPILGSLGFSIAATIETFKQVTFLRWQEYSWIPSAAFACAFAADVLLTGSLVTFLLRSQTGVRRTDSMLKLLIVYTINTGLLTSSMCLLFLIFSFLRPDDLIHSALSIPATKSYAISVLAVLNARRSLKDRSERIDTSAFGTFGMSARDGDGGGASTVRFRRPSRTSTAGPSRAHSAIAVPPTAARPFSASSSAGWVGAEDEDEEEALGEEMRVFAAGLRKTRGGAAGVRAEKVASEEGSI